jgi:phosphoribosylformylglycinamidine cyclo-ligase
MAAMSDKKSLTYKDAGVDIDAGNEVVSRIGALVRSTPRSGVLSDLGGFGGLFALPGGLTDPVLVSGTDGVGTKLKIAFATGSHHTVGIDLVAMCVNDIITTGARPLFFLDYFATGALSPDQAESVIAGIAEGCRQAGCALLGGETAEMPGFYAKDEYDMAGFAVGVVERAKIVTGAGIAANDRVVGLASTGVHSNGFSLARKALLEVSGFDLDSQPEPLTRSVGQTLLEPTRIYSRAVTALCDGVNVKGLAHITGGGLVENPPRILGAGLGMELRLSAWEVPPIFGLIAKAGVDDEEMRRTFNMGVGLVVVVSPDEVAETLALIEAAGDIAWDIGRVVQTPGVEPAVTFIS